MTLSVKITNNRLRCSQDYVAGCYPSWLLGTDQVPNRWNLLVSGFGSSKEKYAETFSIALPKTRIKPVSLSYVPGPSHHKSGWGATQKWLDSPWAIQRKMLERRKNPLQHTICRAFVTLMVLWNHSPGWK